MTDEERQKLIAALRRKADTGAVRVPMCGEAADEIERLAALAQSDAEPAEVRAWEANPKSAFWGDRYTSLSYFREDGPDIDCRPLYTAPPRPDASTGLIEAAEITREWAGATSSLVEAHLLDALARELRARAADRSGK